MKEKTNKAANTVDPASIAHLQQNKKILENLDNIDQSITFKTLAEKDEKIILQNLKAAATGIWIVKNIEDYWKFFNNPESERRVRISSQDYFSKPMTLFVNNEISGGRANLLGQKLNWTVEITLHAYDGSIVYQKEEANNMALTVTANSLFFAVYMKSGEIKIYDTNIGSLIVPYYQKSNLAFLSSYSNGNLAFIDLEGKITVINIIKKMAVFENKDSVKSLLLSLNNKSTLNPDDVENNKEETPEFYLKSFYLNDWSIYIDVSNSLSNWSQTYCLNNQLGTWEKVESISASVVTDTKAGNVAQINRKSDDDMDVSIDQPGFGVSLETVEKDLFKLEKDKQDLIDEIGLAVSKMEKRNHSKISKIETIDQMEERIMLYERLEHK